jgi:hypothetical protein
MVSNANIKKSKGDLQKELKKKLEERREKAAATEVSVSSKTNEATDKKNQEKKGIVNNPICKAKGINNAFTCARMIERNTELKALRGNGTRKKVSSSVSTEPTEEPITPTFVEGKGKVVKWSGKTKKVGEEYLMFPSGCTDNEEPGRVKRIFTHKTKKYPKWCSRRRREEKV